MAAGYELLIQPKAPHAAHDAQAVESALEALGARRRPDGTLMWPFGLHTVEVICLAEGDKVLASEVRVPLSEKTDLLKTVLRGASALADQLGLRVVDPHLMKEVTEADAERVATEFLSLARYAGQYMAVSEAVIASYGPAEPTGLKPGTKLMLVLFGGLVVLWLLFDVFATPPPPPPPSSGPPAYWPKNR